MATDIDLSGTWRAARADEANRRSYTDADFDDHGWALATVPGHWRSNPAFVDDDGPVLHRTSFATPHQFGPGADGETASTESLNGRRTWLVLDGIFYTSDVWLDGTYLGDTEGYFFPHTFEITDALAERSEHALALEVACTRPVDPDAKRSLSGAFQTGELIDRDGNPGGIWRPVRLEQSGPVRIRHARVRCGDVRDEGAVVSLRAVLDTTEARTVDLLTTVTPRGDFGAAITLRRSQSLAAGENRVEWIVTVPEPERWWPWALGRPAMYDVHVAVHTDDGALSDERTRRLGLRSVQVRDWIWSINGERLFLKGANQGPNRMALAEAEPADLAADVALAVDAGLDFLRLHAHISRPEIYDAADESGLLLWQDLPLQAGYSRTVRRQARRQAREAVDLLAHHPSVFVWCGHNEPVPSGVAANVLPSWNRTLLDRAIKTVLEGEDGTRPVIAHSGVFPHLPQLDGTDTHLSFGWRQSDERDLPAFVSRWPRLARFVSEFGAQAVPPTDDFLDPAAWPDLDWAGLTRHHGLQKDSFDRYVPPDRFERYDEWKEATEAYQSRVIRYHIETLRRLKYHPTGGFAQFCFADGAPAVSASVLDHERQPKPGFEALRDACRPVIVVADRPPEHVHPGDRLLLDIHAVSDARIAYSDIIVHADLSYGMEAQRAWTFQGDLPADSCVRVGAIAIDVPDITEPLVLDLRLSGSGLDVSNRYGTWVIGGEHAH
jgi:beta-mannosidase